MYTYIRATRHLHRAATIRLRRNLLHSTEDDDDDDGDDELMTPLIENATRRRIKDDCDATGELEASVCCTRRLVIHRVTRSHQLCYKTVFKYG